jgi:uncharacterized protein (TIGR04255 family)
VNREYASDFLTEVIVKADFEPRIVKLQKTLPVAVRKVLEVQLPIRETRDAFSGGLEISLRGGHLDSPTLRDVTPHKEWIFRSEDRAVAVFVDMSALTLSYRSYPGFATLKPTFLNYLTAVAASLSGAAVSRVGMRYINNIEVPEADPTEWSKYIAPALLGVFGLPNPTGELSRVFEIVEFNYGFSQLRCQFGMPNPDYPAPIRKKLFLLDLDAYRTGLMAPDELPDLLDGFHANIKALFEQSITDGLRGVMNGGKGTHRK